MRAVDPDLPVQDVKTLEEVVSQSVAPPRFRFVLVGLFAGLALALSVVGLYGVISQSVAHRTQEIGIRMALGASRATIARMVIIEALALAAIGVAVGVAVSLGATRVLVGFLFGVEATNVATYAMVAIVIAMSAVAASYGPARRAMRADPAMVLRAE